MKRGSGGNAWIFRAFDRVWGMTFGRIDKPTEEKLALDGMKVEVAPKKRRRRRRGGRNRSRNVLKTKEAAIQQYAAKNARRSRNRLERDECGRPAGEGCYASRLVDCERYDDFDLASWPERNRHPKDDTADRSHTRRGSDIARERRRSFSPSRLVTVTE